ncbi:MAG: helix-turn-helix domain-containing protein [Blastocatellia bacterium]
MIKLLVKEVAEREGVRNPLDLSKRAGLHYQTVYSLWRGQSKQIGLETIEKLCRALGVRPGQLFQLDPDIGGATFSNDSGSVQNAKQNPRRRAK